LLFEARPDVFKPMNVGAMRWSWVQIEALDAGEVAELVREAWTQIVPKKVSRALPFMGRDRPRSGQGGGVG
jgi:hypothetical protein